MARIQLRDCEIALKDGLAGTAVIMDASLMVGDTTFDITTVALNTDVTNKVPVGARFTIAGETGTPVHTVTARTPASMGPTTNIVFTPATVAGVVTTAVLTFQPQKLVIKVGDGELNYTENDEYIYDLDRDKLDTVRKGADQPMEVNSSFTYEHITTGTNETIAPMDAIKRRGSAAEWVSSATDKCEPYAVDLEVIHTPPCGTNQKETTTFPDFRSDSREVSFNDAIITLAGRCNALEPIVVRS